MLLFPYTITVNNVEITLNSTNDYQLVKNNIDAYYNDSDTVSIHFPVTALMEDYTQRSLSYPYDLNNLIAECETKNTDLGKINCINMAYPIVINSYNGNNSIAISPKKNTRLMLKRLKHYIPVLWILEMQKRLFL